MESNPRSRIGHQKGFFTLALLAWLPLLIALVSGLAIMASSLTSLQQTENLCLQTHLRLQKNLRENLKALLALNPKAATLRRQREMAEANLKLALASGQPPWVAQATAQKNYVIGKQMALRAQQMRILAEARRLRLHATIELKQQMQDLATSSQNLFGSFEKSLAVVAEPITSLTPDYRPTADFSYQQSQSTTVQISFPKRMPAWIDQKVFHRTIVCGASLKKDGPLWSLAILKDRSWWN